jgi:hypothetical protein
MQPQTTVYTLDDFVRRVVESLLRGDRRGQPLCARCLVKLTKDNLDKSYPRPEIVRVVQGIFSAPGPITHVPAATCGLCAKKKVACLVAPAP